MEIKDFGEINQKGEEEHYHSSGGHHHHHTSRREQKKKKWIKPAIIITLVVVLLTSIVLVRYIRSRSTFVTKEKAEGNGNIELRYKDVSYQGQKYKYNNRITTILLAGLDSEDDIIAKNKFTVAPRADTILLLVIDTQNKKLSVIALNRDTMTKIRRYTIDGYSRGLYTDHLGYAFTYGNGGKVSCENLSEAVSLLLYDVSVNHYLVVNRASIKRIAEIVGPVEVTVPNNDLSEVDQKYTKGNVIVVDKNNIELFVRKRDTSKDFTNTYRMERQQAYINATMEKVLSLIKNDTSSAWSMIEEFEKCVKTDITRSQYLDLVNDINEVSYSAEDYYTPEGTQSSSHSHDEFYVDEEALLDKIVSLFYLKK